MARVKWYGYHRGHPSRVLTGQRLIEAGLTSNMAAMLYSKQIAHIESIPSVIIMLYNQFKFFLTKWPYGGNKFSRTIDPIIMYSNILIAS